MKRIEFHPKFAEDVREAYFWYSLQQEGLGEQFLAALAARIDSLHYFPERFPVVDGRVRQALLDRFPYSLLYMPKQDSISIYACYHAKQNREDWRQRLY